MEIYSRLPVNWEDYPEVLFRKLTGVFSVGRCLLGFSCYYVGTAWESLRNHNYVSTNSVQVQDTYKCMCCFMNFNSEVIYVPFIDYFGKLISHPPWIIRSLLYFISLTNFEI